MHKILLLPLLALITACGGLTEKPAGSDYAMAAEQWVGASLPEMMQALGEPTENYQGMPEHGLAPAVSWLSYSDDYAALEFLEMEGSGPATLQQATQINSVPSHECQIYAELADDGQTVERILVSTFGDCQQWLPIPQPDSQNRMTASVSE